MSFEIPFSHIAEIIMGQSPKGEEVNNEGIGLPLLNGPTEFTDRYPAPVQHTAYAKKISLPGDILFCVRGSTTGRMNYSDQKYCIGRGLAAIRGRNGYPTPYVKAVLETYLPKLLAAATGSTFPNVSKDLINNIPVSVLPVENACNISKLIELQEEKVFTNNQINQTLEQMAQALFKSWFVNFEPVKAKMAVLEAGGSQEDATLAAMSAISGKDADTLAVFEREQPEHYAELKATAELFPSAMQESELGEVPEGWRTENVENIINRLKVKNTFPADCIKQFGQHPVLEQGAKIYQGYHDEEPSFNASLQSPMFIFGDHTCVMHLSTVPFDISKNTLVLKGKGFNTYWTFFALKGKQKFQEYKRHWSDLKVKQVVIPDENNGLLLTKYFAVKCEDLFGLLEQNRKQNLILQNIRDTLLPKLLSGEITLPEAELVISEAENV
ncbi:restriction endonuclease subunit S [Enterobacter hormaechei]|uniref:restriction endonuclease subunit S n=1 Tax=Enterobacter cloacae complex TaxID=354276 RepID=UPI001F49319C|nr:MULTISPECIES: restriction endonuclease subunit S [Enterobacter cloacae complex]MCK6886797.1 restriction endonuclease subunit S [Enterobacter roggenkampii]